MSDLISNIEELASYPTECNLLRNTKIHRGTINTRNLIVGEFIRLCFNKDYPFWKLEKHDSREIKKFIKLQAQLCACIYRICLSYCENFLNYNHIWFFCGILDEYKLSEFIFTNDDNLTSVQFVRLIQNQNRQLETMENPFEESTEPYTHFFIHLAIKKAEKVEWFKKELYMPLVQTRMKIISDMKDEKIEKLDRDRKTAERRGRPRKRKYLPIPVV